MFLVGWNTNLSEIRDLIRESPSENPEPNNQSFADPLSLMTRKNFGTSPPDTSTSEAATVPRSPGSSTAAAESVAQRAKTNVQISILEY